jgi:hypothetical protein
VNLRPPRMKVGTRLLGGHDYRLSRIEAALADFRERNIS